MTEITQGLIVSGLGLLITFASLGLLILVIVVLNKLFPYKEEAEKGEGDNNAETAVVIETAVSGDEDTELAVVIAAALSITQSQTGSSLGASLLEGRSSFWGTRQASSMTHNLQRK
ncbi:MAG TPA: OadG family protein [Longilinea sp.]|nr:OadG family protein [Longilinea sp.]